MPIRAPRRLPFTTTRPLVRRSFTKTILPRVSGDERATSPLANPTLTPLIPSPHNSQEINALRASIARGDILDVSRRIPLVSPRSFSSHDIADIGALVVKHGQRHADLSVVHSLAIFASSRGELRALRSCMLDLLRLPQPNHEGVLSLWSTARRPLHERYGTGQFSNEQEKFFLMDILGYLFISLAIKDVPHAVAMRTILLERDLFSPLHYSSSSFPSIPLNINKNIAAAQITSNNIDPDALRRYSEWHADLELIMLFSKPAEALAYVASLFQSGKIDTARKMVHDLQRGLHSRPPWISPRNVPGWRDSNDGQFLLAIPVAVWNAFISGFMRAGEVEMAESVWRILVVAGGQPTPFTCNAYLDALARRGNYEKMMALWKAMNGRVEKDLHCYTTVITALFEARRPAEAIELFNEVMIKDFAEANKSSSPPSPSEEESSASSSSSLPYDAEYSSSVPSQTSLTVLYNSVIHGALITARPEIAQHLLTEMTSKKKPAKSTTPNPDIATFNTFLQHYAKTNDSKAFAQILRLIASFPSVVPDVVTCTIILTHLLRRSGASDAIERFKTIMKSMNVSMNAITYSAMIDAELRKQQGRESVETAFRLLEAMEEEGLWPNEVTYTGILGGLVKDESLDLGYAEEKEAEILERMRARGIPFNRVTWNFLIRAMLRRTDGMRRSVELYRQMRDSGVRANEDTWYLLMRAAGDLGDVESGQQVLEEMEKAEFKARAGYLQKVYRRLRKVVYGE